MVRCEVRRETFALVRLLVFVAQARLDSVAIFRNKRS